MTWILHLSDPHLGAVSPGQKLDDLKVRVTQEDVETTQSVFRRTLASLREYIKSADRPAAVVVSGDISYRGRPDGFDAFVSLLDEYGDLLPERDRMVVVPGNHDVVWDAEPGTPERYKPFLSATRGQKCATPLLDGVDFNTAGTTKLLAGALGDPHVVEHDEFLIIPLNSSNWCGTITELDGDAWNDKQWVEKLEALGDEREQALEQLKWLRQQDLAKISQAQIDALRELFADTGVLIDRGNDPRPRIAVLHHQLLPVSTRVELKPFESLVNLGLVRELLRDFGVDVVLHGHKHESGIYWDFTGRVNAPSLIERRTLVVASPGHFQPHQPVMRALEFRGNARARNVHILDFNGLDGSTTQPEVGDELTLPLWLGQMETESTERTTICGRTTHATYARVCAQFELEDRQTMNNVVCEVDDPSDAESLPHDYPETGFSDSQRWFNELVDWWQLPQSRLVREGVLSFNHGVRIRSRWGDQVERAARLLNAKDESSRGFVLLVDPDETGRQKDDPRPLDRGAYPAFVLAEFALSQHHGGTKLDCFAYFRKQEMRYWWPVNVAELRRLQSEVAACLDSEVPLGRIVTFSAIALYGKELPGVAVTELDRHVETEGAIWRLAGGIAFPASEVAAGAADEWRRILDELVGSGRAVPPVPALGHKVLLEELRRFKTIASGESLGDVTEKLERLSELYRLTEPPLEEAQKAPIVRAVTALREAVDRAFDG